jgi:hypothetical protein
LVDTTSIPSFTVVRNPINRFLSYTNYWRTGKTSLINILQTEKGVTEFFSQTPFSLDMFLKPQWKYCNKNIKIWKYESGLGNNFVDWLNNEFNLTLSPVPFFEKDTQNSLNLKNFPPNLEQELRRVYKWDFDYLNYT